MADSAVWAANRKGWVVTRSRGTGFFLMWPQAMENDEVVFGPADWAECCNASGKLNQVASYFGGQQLLEQTPEDILRAYDVLVADGTIKAIELTPVPATA